ncbi:MAG: cytochrome c oxidase subunit II [Caulobacteraceae bacterium]|nr:cytochrome c oxidase subunit II [Caulobacteraceae bacterium]
MSPAQSALFPAAEQAATQFDVLTLMLWICGVMYLVVLLFVALAIWRGARARAAADSPVTEAADPTLSRALAIWSCVVVLGLTALVVGSFFADRSLAAARDRETLVIRATGQQWWWRFAYRTPGGAWVETANELHLPAGRTARVEVGSTDVIHSFWAPPLAGKMDVIPGHANVLDLTPQRIGWYRGTCGEFCGLQHAHMAFDVRVESPADFDRWLAAQATPAAPQSGDPSVARGQVVVTQGQCAECHTIRGTAAAGKAGPDLTHIGSRRSIAAGTLPMSRGGLEGWIEQPAALKPGTNMPAVSLSPSDADAASAYLLSLK